LIDRGLVINDGTVALGAPAPAGSWFFAEGTTLPDFLNFWTISNPSASVAHATATYLTNLGEVETLAFTVAANSRLTVQVYNPNEVGRGALALEREGFATTFTSDVPIVIERPIY